uniref:Hyaluronidase n=1 Tax=Nannospalax galili TaxID=1026970 RepID=A0A8C6QPE1_NANGA
MGRLSCKHLFFGCFFESKEASLTMLVFLLIPCRVTTDYRAAPIIPNVTLLWAWNVPTDDCVGNFSHSLDLSLFSLVGSPRKTVVGQSVVLFYTDRLGIYPHIDAKNVEHYGAVPQAVNLQDHLKKCRTDIAHYMPVDKLGLAVIDWEEWRPTWLRNWKPKDIYRNKSIELVLKQHPGMNIIEATKKAKEEFEKAGKSYMLETLKLGNSLRPKHLWGYYLFPDCYNNKFSDPHYNGNCPDVEKKRNDDLNWMWKESTGLYPSVYLRGDLRSSKKAALYVRYRVVESIRVSKVKSEKNPVPIFVYIRLVFTDNTTKYLLQDDLVNTIGEIVALGPAGIIIWDAVSLAQRSAGCPRLYEYMKGILNPYIVNVTLAAKMCSQTLCKNQGLCTRKNISRNDYLHLNPNNFKIQFVENGMYEIIGNPTLHDLDYFSNHFKCSCFANTNCKATHNMDIVEKVHVCTGDNICINAIVEPNLAFYLIPRKRLLFVTVSVSNH